MKPVLRHALLRATTHQTQSHRRRSARTRRWIPLILMSLVIAPHRIPGGQTKNELEQKIQSIIRTFSSRLGIAPQVMVRIVPQNPRLISVEYAAGRTDRFQMSFEEGFLPTLNDTELRAAVAHEMGHIWIYTHFPFLQTELLANQQARKLVTRSELARVYQKVWERNGEKGNLIAVLGPEEGGGAQRGTSIAEPSVDSAATHETVESLTLEGPRVYVETANELRSLTGLSGSSEQGRTPPLPTEISGSLTHACPDCIVMASKENADYIVVLGRGSLHEGLRQWAWTVYDKGGILLDKGATNLAENSAQQAIRSLLTNWRRAHRRMVTSAGTDKD